MPFFNGKLSTAIENSKFSGKMSQMGQKDGNFLFWSMLELMVTFLGIKNESSPKWRLRHVFFVCINAEFAALGK